MSLRLRPRAGTLRPVVQLGLVLVLNFTVVGSFVVLPLLPALRLDLPVDIGASGQKVCTFGNLEREMSGFWPVELAILVIGVFLVVGLVAGRALCGWACAIGFIQDLLTSGRRLARARALEPSRRAHRALTGLRYSILLFIVIFALALGISSAVDQSAGGILRSTLPEGTAQVAPYCAACPTPAVYYVTNTVATGDPKLHDPLSLVAVFVFAAFIAGSVAVPRFFCRYFCPVGALTSPFNKVSLLSVRKSPSKGKCTGCSVCTTVCPQRAEGGVSAPAGGRVSTVDCDLCLKCVDACPEKALSLSFAGRQLYSGGRNWWRRRT